MTTLTNDYIAGFFDGEGSATLAPLRKNGKVYTRFEVVLAQSGENGLVLLERIQKQHGGKIYKNKDTQGRQTKTAYKLYWNKEEAITFLVTMLPHLQLKKQAAQDVLDYLRRKNGTTTI